MAAVEMVDYLTVEHHLVLLVQVLVLELVELVELLQQTKQTLLLVEMELAMVQVAVGVLVPTLKTLWVMLAMVPLE
jgi:hypothetical protein